MILGAMVFAIVVFVLFFNSPALTGFTPAETNETVNESRLCNAAETGIAESGLDCDAKKVS